MMILQTNEFGVIITQGEVYVSAAYKESPRGRKRLKMKEVGSGKAVRVHMAPIGSGTLSVGSS